MPANFIENINIFFPIMTFVAGFFVSRFTLSKKEKKDVQQVHFKNSKELRERQQEMFIEFTRVLNKYIDHKGMPTINDFLEIATAGEKYFYQQKIVADAGSIRLTYQGAVCSFAPHCERHAIPPPGRSIWRGDDVRRQAGIN